MLGLKRGTVQVVAHQADWQTCFEQERALLKKHIGHLVLDIQHVGSTAVPGLVAKPIIDITVGISSPAVVIMLKQPLAAIGYIDRGDGGENGGYLFVKESAPEVRTHHMHVVTIDDPQWRNYLLFRDTLRSDAAVRSRYAQLKQTLQKQFAADRKAYTAAKHGFIRQVIDANTRL